MPRTIRTDSQVFLEKDLKKTRTIEAKVEQSLDDRRILNQRKEEERKKKKKTREEFGQVEEGVQSRTHEHAEVTYDGLQTGS